MTNKRLLIVAIVILALAVICGEGAAIAGGAPLSDVLTGNALGLTFVGVLTLIAATT